MVNPQTSPNFGNGEVGGDNSWTSPVYGTTADGNPVTVSFGQESRTGQTLIADGHISGSTFYSGSGSSKGHDHFGPNGEPFADRGRYSG